MRVVLALCVALLAPKTLHAAPAETSCVSCHEQLEGEPTAHRDTDIHVTHGISCHQCHGGDPEAGFDGDPEAAHDVAKRWHRPGRTEIPAFCGRCHADQLAQYLSSVHAAALERETGALAPTCVDCHGVHGALPAGVRSLEDSCGSCHSREATMFREVEARKHLDLEPCIRCLNCHGDHAVQRATPAMIGVGETSTCMGCHVAGEPGYEAARRMGEDLGTLRLRLAQATGLLDDAERAGLATGRGRMSVQEAGDSLAEARVLVHSFDLGRFTGVTIGGIAAADQAAQVAQRLLTGRRNRRIGIALVVIVIGLVALAIAVRRFRA